MGGGVWREVEPCLSLILQAFPETLGHQDLEEHQRCRRQELTALAGQARAPDQA